VRDPDPGGGGEEKGVELRASLKVRCFRRNLYAAEFTPQLYCSMD
jgi:hypothetical protein